MRLKFEPGSHRYTIDGKPLTGVTTILGVIAKPALVPWASKMCADFIKENSTKDGNKYYITEDLLNEAKNAHKSTLKKAGDAGHEVHDEIEQFIKNGTEPKNKRSQKFVDWYKEEGYEVLSSEQKVYSEKLWVAGTLDLILKDKKGKVWLADIKTSNGVYNSYLYQMGGYELLLKDTPDLPQYDFAGYIIIHIDKSGEITEYILDSISLREQAMETFKSALQIYRAENNITICLK